MTILTGRGPRDVLIVNRTLSQWRGDASGGTGLDAHLPDREQRARGEALQPITVVVGDSNQLLVQALGALLDAQPDVRVIRSQTDIEAVLDAVDTVGPDVVLIGTDLLFQNFDRCVATFRERRTPTRLIVMSPHEDEAVLEASVRAGAAGYVHGGLPSDEIVAAVRRVHGGDVLFAPQKLVGLLQRPSRPADPPEAPAGTLPGPRELEVLQALAHGLSTQEIAEHLGITTHTVRSHVRNVMAKLKARTKLEAVMIALREGLIKL